MTPLPLVKVVEAAELLSLSRATVHGLIQCGDLVAVRTNPSKRKQRVHVRITRESLDKFLAKRTV